MLRILRLLWNLRLAQSDIFDYLANRSGGTKPAEARLFIALS